MGNAAFRLEPGCQTGTGALLGWGQDVRGDEPQTNISVICHQPCLAQHQAVNTAVVRPVQPATGSGGPGVTLSAQLVHHTDLISTT